VSDANGGATRLARSAAGWGILAALVAYTAMIHYGVGPARPGLGSAWYTPSAFLLQSAWLAPLVDPPERGLATFVLPALLGVVAVFLVARSAVARALALSCLAAVALFAFYGLYAPFPWRFFGWRGSATLVLTAASVGFAAGAPWLATSWLRRGWPLRAALFLPVAFAVIAFLRNATGTDPSLPFSISPWPAISVFGLEVGALLVALVWLGVALGTAALARARGAARAGPAALVLAAALGIGVPLALLALASALGMLSFRLGRGTASAAALACALALALVALWPAGEAAAALRRRAVAAGVAAALVGAPVLAGEAWAYVDYARTRDVRAREIIDALQAYYQRESLYPDDLEQLVKGGDLASIPSPAIGFGFLYDGAFRYQSFGTSYLLEFPAPRWVECAYTPAYADEDDDEDSAEPGDPGTVNAGTADAGDDEGPLGESWSCPSKPPELW
jgi:hypothetical protein